MNQLQDLLGSPSVDVRLGALVVNLLLAGLLSQFLSWLYIRHGRALSNRRLFAHNFLLLSATTTLVITVVKSSLALSLGLVGALSIVRFRSAIKEPEELAFLFLAIAIGLGLGADQRVVTLCAVAVISGLFWLRSTLRPGAGDSALFLTVSTKEDDGSLLERISGVLADHGETVHLRRFDQRQGGVEIAYHVQFENFAALQAARTALAALGGDLELSFIDNRGVL